MKKAIVLFALFCLVGSAVPANAAENGSNIKSVAKVATYPEVHPIKTIKGFLFGLVKVVGTGIDTAERVAALIHAGANKVDEIADKIEDAVNPVPPAPVPAKP